MKIYKFDSSRSISSSLSIIFLMALGVLFALFVLEKAEEIVSDAPEFPAFNIQKRTK